MSLSYTTGNPNNLTGGASASMNDIQGPFVDIRTFLTDGSGTIGDTILASPNNAVWTPVFGINGVLNGGLTTSSYYFSTNGLVLSAGAGSGTAQGVWVAPTASDVAVVGKTTRLRLRVPFVVNAVAPAITITWGLYVVSALGGVGNGTLIVTLGTVVAGSTAASASPPASGPGVATGASFDMSLLTPGSAYIIGVTGSGSQAATSLVMSQPILEMRHT